MYKYDRRKGKMDDKNVMNTEYKTDDMDISHKCNK